MTPADLAHARALLAALREAEAEPDEYQRRERCKLVLEKLGERFAEYGPSVLALARFGEAVLRKRRSRKLSGGVPNAHIEQALRAHQACVYLAVPEATLQEWAATLRERRSAAAEFKTALRAAEAAEEFTAALHAHERKRRAVWRQGEGAAARREAEAAGEDGADDAIGVRG